jgi:hypothetical protein
MWEQAYEREQGAPATMEAKSSSTTYAALQTRHKLAASQLQELLRLLTCLLVDAAPALTDAAPTLTAAAPTLTVAAGAAG